MRICLQKILPTNLPTNLQVNSLNLTNTVIYEKVFFDIDNDALYRIRCNGTEYIRDHRYGDRHER